MINQSLHSLVARLGGELNYPRPQSIFYLIKALGYIGMAAAVLAALALFVPSLKRPEILLALDAVVTILFFGTFVSLTYKTGIHSCTDINYTSRNKVMNGGTLFYRKKNGKVFRYGWEKEEMYEKSCSWAHEMGASLFWSFVFFGITWALGVYYKDGKLAQNRKDEEGGADAETRAVEKREIQSVQSEESTIRKLRLGNKTGAT